MKCELIRDMESPNPAYDFDEARRLGPLYDVPHNIPVPLGTVLDEPDAFRLVRNGCAVPADEECEKAARMTPEQMRSAKEAYELLLKGMSTGNPVHDADPEEEEGTEPDEDDLFGDE